MPFESKALLVSLLALLFLMRACVGRDTVGEVGDEDDVPFPLSCQTEVSEV